MPVIMRDLIVDCGPPVNIDDEAFALTMNQKPVAKRISEYTRSSFHHISHSTFALRQELVSLINGSSAPIPFEELLECDKKIVQALDEIPSWQNQNENRGPHISRTLLQLQLYQLQLLLHRPCLPYQPQSNRYDYSATVRLRAAISILDLHQSLMTAGYDVWYIMRTDILTAVLSVCFSFSISGLSDGESDSPVLETHRPN